MLKWTLIFSIILCLAGKSGQAQTGPANIDTLLVGTWNGTSICQMKNSSCHDETVVYHISKKKGIDTFYIDGNRIVNVAEVGIVILHFVYNKKTNQLRSDEYGTWTFNIKGGKLEGTLFVRGDLFRKIILYKQ